MVTKLYLHRTEFAVNGLTAEQSSLTPDANLFTNEDGTENRVMDKTISVSAQTSLDNTQTGDTNAHNYYIARWVSPNLAQTSVAANTWTLEFAASEANANANFPRNGAGALRVNVYVWKPSNGTKYGTILDGNTNADGEEAGTSQTVINCTFSGSAVSSLTAGDAVIVIELWAIVTQGTATARAVSVFYDGTTEASTSNMAARLETPENLAFAYTAALSETVSTTDSVATQKAFSRALSESTSTTDSVARTYNAIRILGDRNSITLDGTDDYLDCGNDATLWSQGLTKFSFSFWWYQTAIAGGSDEWLLDHNSSNNHGIRVIDAVGTDPIIFNIKNSVGTNIQATATSDGKGAGIWRHITCTYDNSLGSQNMKIFRDGTQQGQANLTETINSSAVMALGATVSTNAPNARIKDFRWWTTKALTSGEVTDVYNNSLSAPTPDFWLKMQEGGGNPVDSIAAKTTTLRNGATWISEAPNVWIFETVPVSDTLTRSVTLTRALTDAVGITDILDKIYNAFRSLSDTVTTTDDVDTIYTPGGTNYDRPLSDSVSVSDSVETSSTLTRTLNESVTTTDDVNRMVAFARTLADTVTTSDTVVAAMTLTRALSDAVGITDAVNRLYNAFRNPNESVTTTDAVDTVYTPGSGTNFDRPLSESVSTSDQVDRSVSNSRDLTESVPTSDLVTRAAVMTRALADNVGITDAVNSTIDFFRNLNDNVSTSDNVNRILGVFKNLAEFVTTNDVVVKVGDYVRSLVESITVTDNVERTTTGQINILTSDVPIILNKWLQDNWTDDPISTVEHYLIPPKSKITFGTRFDLSAGSHSDMHVHVRNVSKNVTALSNDATVQENSATLNLYVEVRYIPDSPPDFSGDTAGAPSDMMWQIRSYIDELIRSDPQQLYDSYGIEVISIMQERPDSNTPVDVHAQNVIENMYQIIFTLKVFYTLKVDRVA